MITLRGTLWFVIILVLVGSVGLTGFLLGRKNPVVLPANTPLVVQTNQPPAQHSDSDHSDWYTERDPAFTAFNGWAARYLAAAPTERPALLAEGRLLARERREVLAHLLRADPRAARAAALPLAERRQHPGEIVAALGDQIAGIDSSPPVRIEDAADSDLPSVTKTATDWVYTYKRPAERTDLTYIAEVSPDGQTWSTDGVKLEQVSSSNGVNIWHAVYPQTYAKKIFFRLKVTP